MEQGLVHLHSLLRWVIIICLLAAIIKSYSGWQNKKTFSSGDRKLWLITMISAHITLLLGIYQLIAGRYGIIYGRSGDNSLMQDDFYRFFWIEHPVMMFAAIILITIGRGQAKKPIPDATKYKKAFWFFFIAFLLIMAAVPWPFRKVARPLFPGMSIESTK